MEMSNNPVLLSDWETSYSNGNHPHVTCKARVWMSNRRLLFLAVAVIF